MMKGMVFAERYKLEDFIGQGGMSLVYRAVDIRTGHSVAVKILKSEYNSDKEFLERFQREAQAASLMSHHNLVNLLDVGVEGEYRYLVLEYVNGNTLKDIIRQKGRLNYQTAIQITIRILSALQHAHDNGIIHRDIKPQNVLIHADGHVKVSDFGIARMTNAFTISKGDTVVGSVHYSSPEQATGSVVEATSDIYSTGVVLYEMLTGRPPFTGDSAVAIAYQHVSEVATPPSTIVPGLPKMWDSICAKAMAKDRQNRYATASEFKNDLLTFMNGGVPMAAAFNPLTDLTNMKARKQAEMDAATVPMAPATDAPTQAFNPVTGQFEAVPNPNGGVETKTRAEQRAKAAQERKKKQIIIASVIGSIVVLLAVIGIFFALNGHKNTADLVSVPDFTDTSNISQARVEEQLKALGLKLDARDDSTSSQPKGTITKQNPKGGKKVAKGSTVSVWFSTGPQAVSVPDVSGKTQEEAKGILEAAGFKIGNVMTVDSASIEKDKVVNTNPAAHSKQTKGTIITLYISSGMTKIPDGLVGQAKDSVIAQLKQAGLTQITIESEYSDSVQSGAVTRIDPGSGSTVEAGTAVTIWVSTGKQQVSVPFVANSTLAEAKSILEAAGFQVSVNGPQDDDATVVSMSPNGGSQADSGSTITLTTKKSSSDTNNRNFPGGWIVRKWRRSMQPPERDRYRSPQRWQAG